MCCYYWLYYRNQQAVVNLLHLLLPHLSIAHPLLSIMRMGNLNQVWVIAATPKDKGYLIQTYLLLGEVLLLIWLLESQHMSEYAYNRCNCTMILVANNWWFNLPEIPIFRTYVDLFADDDLSDGEDVMIQQTIEDSIHDKYVLVVGTYFISCRWYIYA